MSLDLTRKIELLKAKIEYQNNLPHLYGKKHYAWSRKFYESTNKINLLCSGNQCGKSSLMIRKCIHWATEKSLWAKLWPTEPKQFWYLYPTLDVATIEFKEKWVKEWLPKCKTDPKFGWEEEFSKEKKIHNIAFNSGVTVYFKSYATDVSFLQSSSIYSAFLDEELPIHLYDELTSRMNSPTVKGYFHMAFTATLGQVFWYRAMERIGKKDEVMKDALKIQVSLRDCMKYEDGSPGPFTKEYIKELEAKYPEQERKRRIDGRFVLSNEDLKYHAFNRVTHLVEEHKTPESWLVYAGIDIGSGGPGGKQGSHPPAIAFISVKPDFTKARVIKIWIPEASESFTAGDVFKKYLSLKREIGRPIVAAFYDHQSKDFKTICERAMEPIQPAEKGQDLGADILNTLFKYNMMKIYLSDPCAEVLATQLESLKKDTDKKHAWDDGIDAVRFACTKIPWDFSGGQERIEGKAEDDEDGRTKRYNEWRANFIEEEERVDKEFSEWQSLFDGEIAGEPEYYD